ncbi:MAG: hypothetical protein EBZ48_05385, partial [Proteobacteria bacterium]|nr:hypothetical protein [Pseudomonadota bacterium]
MNPASNTQRDNTTAAAPPSTANAREAPSPLIAPPRDTFTTTTLSTQRATPVPLEELRDTLRDRIQRGAIVGARAFAYASTGLVAAITLGQVASIPAGFNPFEVLHTHHLLSHVSTVAHMTVMFLAASAGFGLWRFRQTEDSIQAQLNSLLTTFRAEKTARELLKLRLSPLKEHALQVLRSDSSPASPNPSRESATALAECIIKLEADPNSQTGQPVSRVPVKERLATLELLSATHAHTLGSNNPTHAPVPNVDFRAVESALNTIATLHNQWRTLHDDLSKLLPKINLPQAHQIALQLKKQLAEIAHNPDRDRWQELTAQALQMETSYQDLNLDKSSRALIAYVVEKMQSLSESASDKEISELASSLSRAFTRVADKIVASIPGTIRYDLDRFDHHKRIRDFSQRYPNSSVRASVAGLVAAVSYWISCQESLNALLPTASDLYANSEVGLKFFKDIVPFVLQGGVAFAAGAVNSRFRPHLVRASLELSRLTFACVA